MTHHEIVNTLGILIILAITFYFVLKELFARSTLLMSGAAASIIWGASRNFYTGKDALSAVSLSTILLLLLITTLANILSEAGLFNWVSIAIAKFSQGRKRRLFICLTIFTLIFSMVADNLTVIIIMGALTVTLLQDLDIPVEPFIISEVIASNIGGASTLIGDFPNLIIAEQAGIPFVDFLKPNGMLWINCLIQAVILLFLLFLYRKEFQESQDLIDELATTLPVVTMDRGRKLAIRNRQALYSGLFAIVLTLTLFATTSRHRLEPFHVALIGTCAALIGSGLDHANVINKAGVENALAFVGAFILAGAFAATGVLSHVAESLIDLYDYNPAIASATLITLVAIITSMIDAGPTTAAFIPLIAALDEEINAPGHVLWWTLSFGVLAGSSATILGATAGEIAATHVERAASLGRPAQEALTGGLLLETSEASRGRAGFVWRYSQAGVPSAIMMIIIASFFVWLLYSTG